MAHYVIGLTDVSDQDGMSDYIDRVEETVNQYGGRYMFMGEVVEVREGKFKPTGGAVIEFDDAEAIRRWYESPEYAPLKKLREESGSTNLVVMRSFDRP